MTDIRPEEAISKFRTIAEAPYQRLSQWKKQTERKIMGCVAMYVPEELIHAAGFLPITPLGTRARIPLADEHVQTQVCPPVRSYLELPLKGDLDFLDGIVIAQKVPLDEIIAGVCNAIAIRVGELANKLPPESDICFTGGVAINGGVVQKLGGFLGVNLLVPEGPQTTGALGAALIGLDIVGEENGRRGEEATR